mmetsp:Transcript_80219/g.126513  ORF Transcript_80219/g.126513 Transcript_80219/m.126513 type:complete len:160 (-) Transcript_80219:41-520(-)
MRPMRIPSIFVARRESVRRFATSSKQAAEKRRVKEADLREKPFAERGFQNARDRPRERAYFPFQEEILELPGGRKQVQVVASKRDVDGYLEAQLVFQTPTGNRLFHLNQEELGELEKLAPRLSEYLELYQLKAQEAAEGQQEEDLSKALEGAQVRRLSE